MASDEAGAVDEPIGDAGDALEAADQENYAARASGTSAASASRARPRRFAPALIAIVVVVTAVVGIVALVRRNGQGSPTKLNAAVAATESQETARFAASELGPSALTASTQQGVIDFNHRLVQLSNTIDMFGHTVHVEERLVDGQAFLSADYPTSLRGRWVVLTVDLAGLRKLNPTDLLSRLRTAATTSTVVGQDTVRGVSTTHRQLTVDDGVLLNDGSVPSPVTDGPTARVDVWVDHEGRLRRIDLPASDDTATDRLEFYDFGVAVRIAAPPANTRISEQQFEQAVGSTLPKDSLPPDVSVVTGPPGQPLPPTPTESATSPTGPINPPTLTGPWAEIENGVTDGHRWTLWRARATFDATCTSLEIDGVTPHFSIPGPTHNGYSAFCAPTPVDGALPIVAFNTDAPNAQVGQVVASINTVRVEFGDGTHTDVPVNPASHTFVLFSPKVTDITDYTTTDGTVSCIDDICQTGPGSS